MISVNGFSETLAGSVASCARVRLPDVVWPAAAKRAARLLPPHRGGNANDIFLNVKIVEALRVKKRRLPAERFGLS